MSCSYIGVKSLMLLLQTQAYATHGGMQTYMRRIAEIMSGVCQDIQVPFSSASVTDSEVKPELHPNLCRYDEFIAASGSKARFLAATVAALWRKTERVAVLGHINLATTGEYLKRLGLIDHYVVILHGVEAWVPAGTATRQSCRRASRIVATTRYTAKEFQLQNRFVHPAMRIIPLALPNHTLPQLSEPPRNKRLVVLTVGRLDATERYKGFEELIRAVGRLTEGGTPIELRIVGTGDDRSRLEALCATMASSDVVKFLSSVPEERMASVYREADVFAMPSKKEGFGIVFLEAMQFGKPCIGGNHGGTPEVLRHGTDGFLVEFGDENALFKHLGAFAADRSLVERMGRSAYEHAASDYVFPVMQARWSELLLDLHNSTN